MADAVPLGENGRGISLSAGWIRLNGRRDLLRCSFMFIACVVAMALSPWYGLAFMLLVIGGLGTAAFATMQTSLVLTEAPAAATSRVMGIVTMCIGTGPLGVLAIGLLADEIGAAPAILVTAGLGIAGLTWTWVRLGRAPVSLRSPAADTQLPAA